jgi:hypothetical protein
MAELQQESSIEKGTDAWNVAQGYTHLKILKPLVEMDKLVRIAIYGCENIEDSMQTPEEFKIMMRIEAMNRLIDTLREIIENSDFAMNQKETKNDLLKLNMRISNVEAVIQGISRKTNDARTGETKTILNEEHFWICLEELRTIKREIPDPLNKNSLIFPSSDETDFDKLKELLINGG